MESCHDDDTSLENIPEDVVCRIFSLLPMRNVACASASCSALLRVWSTHPHLAFDEETLGLRRPPSKPAAPEDEDHLVLIQQQRDEHAMVFVRLVDSILMSPRRCSSTAAPLAELTVRFAYLRRHHAPCVDRWVRFALASTTTRRLTIDLLPHSCYNPDRLWYEFPCSLLSAGTPAAAVLEHLHLRQGALAVGRQMPPPVLSNLATLVLARVRVSSEDLERLLSSCHKLETLKLKRCEDLEYVTVSPAHGLRQLRSLTIKKCWSVARLGMSGAAIDLLCIAGHNLTASLLLGSAATASPALRVTTASFNLEFLGPKTPGRGAMQLELLQLAHAMPGLESLSLTLGPKIKVVVAPPTRNIIAAGGGGRRLLFHHLKRVDISLETPFRNSDGTIGRDDDLLFVYPLLDAAPALEDLSLQLTRFVVTTQGLGTATLRKHPGLPHHNLRAVDIASLELVLHILEKATALRSISLQPKWVDDEDFIVDMADEIALIRDTIARYIAPAVPSGSGIVLQVK